MAGELNVNKVSIFEVGQLVQRAQEGQNGGVFSGIPTAKEGILKSIFRAKPNAKFFLVVEWTDGSGTETLRSGQVSISNHIVFPYDNSPIAQSQVWQAGVSHYWTISHFLPRKLGVRCIFCGTRRSQMAYKNAIPCDKTLQWII